MPRRVPPAAVDSGAPAASVFAEIGLRRLCSQTTLARAEDYAAAGRVRIDHDGERQMRATVQGTMPYRVELVVAADGRPGWSCTCPAAEDGAFCKHCAAVVLTLGKGASNSPSRQEPPHAKDRAPTPDLGAYLAGLDRQRLVDLVLDAARRHPRFRERLVAEAAKATGGQIDASAWRQQIDEAFAPYGDHVDYRAAGGWAEGIHEVIDALQELCDDGHPDTVVVLAEHAFARAEAAVQYVDDSDGHLNHIAERLSDLHLAACTDGDVDPAELARRLIELELSAELDGFYQAAATYADVLGSEGIAEYRRLLDARARQSRGKAGAGDASWRLRSIRIGLAEASGDPDEVIAVRGADLHSSDDYLAIARILVANGRIDEAMDWARRGLTELADRRWQPPGLRDFLAGLLRTRGDEQAAVELYWTAFRTAPGLDAFRRLLAEGGPAQGWQERAIADLRARLEPEAGGPSAGAAGHDAHVLVEILMHEGEIDEAWAAARSHGCHRRTWLALARAREADHPLDSIAIYEPELLQNIEAKNNSGYQAAADLMERVRRLSAAAGQPERFTNLLATVRAQHKPKRNLMALLDARRW